MKGAMWPALPTSCEWEGGATPAKHFPYLLVRPHPLLPTSAASGVRVGADGAGRQCLLLPVQGCNEGEEGNFD